jgi:peptidoglycan/xylan/chitin deacetylase (PgdA/CDA1 family)
MAGIRFDRALTKAVFLPLRRALGPGEVRLPVLMYHRISDELENGVSPYYQVNTSRKVFRQHLQQLADEGCKTISLAALAGQLARKEPLAPKTVAITFDDGFRDFGTEAFPALQEHGFTATVFLPTAFIQNERRSFKGIECLTWEEVRQLRKAGIEFGSHSVNHPKLVELGWAEIESELRDSKNQLEQHLGESVTTFAYPYAFPQENQEFAQGLRSRLREIGYCCCALTEIGRVKAGDDPFRLKRLPANSMDDKKLFQAKLEGGYDWLAWPQAAFKKLKRRPAVSVRANDAAARIQHAS